MSQTKRCHTDLQVLLFLIPLDLMKLQVNISSPITIRYNNEPKKLVWV